MIGGVVTQFWTDVIWDVDYLFVDMPPGTGDVALSVFQSLPLDGIVIVASPQDLVSMVVEKAVKMAEMMDVPIVGVVENMSYLLCPDCGREIPLFGQGRTQAAAEAHGLKLLLLQQLPERLPLAGQVPDCRLGGEPAQKAGRHLPDAFLVHGGPPCGGGSPSGGPRGGGGVLPLPAPGPL